MNQKKILFLGIIILLATSCSKYDDNTGLNLQSKNKRLLGEWELVYFKKNYANGIEETLENGIYNNSNANIQSGYTYTQTIIFNENGYFQSERILEVFSDTALLANTWSWMDGTSKKEMIRINANNALGPTDTYIIKKLTKSELTLEFDYSYNYNSTTQTGLKGEFKFKKK
jgi:hypothetical protein